MAEKTEKMISPQYLYDHPERFGGIMSVGKISGHPEYPVGVFKLMKNMFPDFPEKLAKDMKEFIVTTNDRRPAIFFGDDIVDLFEIPDEIYEEIKKFL